MGNRICRTREPDDEERSHLLKLNLTLASTMPASQAVAVAVPLSETEAAKLPRAKAVVLPSYVREWLEHLELPEEAIHTEPTTEETQHNWNGPHEGDIDGFEDIGSGVDISREPSEDGYDELDEPSEVKDMGGWWLKGVQQVERKDIAPDALG